MVIERDTKAELQEAIKGIMEDAKFKIVSISVLEQKLGFEAWIVIDMPENPDADLLRTGQLNVGFESE